MAESNIEVVVRKRKGFSKSKLEGPFGADLILRAGFMAVYRSRDFGEE